MSVADALRAEQRAVVGRLSPDERIALAFALGRRDLAFYAAAQGVDAGEALRRLVRQRGAGRNHSSSASR